MSSTLVPGLTMTTMITVLEGRLKRWSFYAFQRDDMKNSRALKSPAIVRYFQPVYPVREQHLARSQRARQISFTV
jgi:hypothetical protein